MNIVHIAPNATYAEGWSYQENLLTKYQAKLGHNVTLIVPNTTWGDGKKEETTCCDYISKDGFRVIRLAKKNTYCKFISKYYYHLDVYKLLLEIKPEIVFFHGLVNNTIFQVTKYKRKVNKSLIIIQDNHLDYNIGKIRNNPLDLFMYLKNRIVFKLTNKYIDKVYGVTPWREEYANKVYGVPKDKIDLLLMGADDENIHISKKNEIRKYVRNLYNIPEEAFLVVTGGKIDVEKNIHILIDAVIKSKSIYILFFGSLEEDVKPLIEKQMEYSRRVVYAGWIPGNKVYDYFFAADLACFPGRHSVLWEQACASKVPCLFKRWEGMEHVNVGGNACFIDNIDSEEVLSTLLDLKFSEKYYAMKEVAMSAMTDVFLYSNIAKKSIADVMKP